MELTVAEKELFERYDKELREPASYHLEPIVYEAYYKKDSYEEQKIAFDYLKKLILEVAKKREYHITGDESFDIDELLEKDIEVDRRLVGFKHEYYKDPRKLSIYFDELTKNMNWEQTETTLRLLNYANDEFRLFFVKYLPKLVGISDQLDYEANNDIEPLFIRVMSEVNTAPPEEDDFIVSADDFGWEGDDEWDHLDVTKEEKEPEDELSEDKLTDYIKFLNVAMKMIKYRDYGFDVAKKLGDIVVKKKLEDFYNDEDFSRRFDSIMSHDKTKSAFYFHGTQSLESAQSIMEQGLGMMCEDLNRTAEKEMTKDEIILYNRGFDGAIGRSAVVIIDVPINSNNQEEIIVEEIDPNYQINFLPSGLQGLNGRPEFIVKPEHIVGYIDKENKKVVFNPKYKVKEEINYKEK